MTWPITDEMVRRFREAAGPYLGLPKAPAATLLSEDAIRAWKNEVARGILEKTLAPVIQTLDRRAGEKDRRKASPCATCGGNHRSSRGRRAEDRK